MLILYPLIIVAAAVLAWQRRGLQGGRGPAWYLTWAIAGFLVSLSIVTGLSIGLFVAPIAAVVLLWVATRSPHLLEASGFLAGIASAGVLFENVET
jgi:hypothetical protein